MWFLMWTLRLALWVKLFSHSLQVKGFSPVCLFMWTLRFVFRAKISPHNWQVKGEVFFVFEQFISPVMKSCFSNGFFTSISFSSWLFSFSWFSSKGKQKQIHVNHVLMAQSNSHQNQHKSINASKPATIILDPVRTRLLKEMLKCLIKIITWCWLINQMKLQIIHTSILKLPLKNCWKSLLLQQKSNRQYKK